MRRMGLTTWEILSEFLLERKHMPIPYYLVIGDGFALFMSNLDESDWAIFIDRESIKFLDSDKQIKIEKGERYFYKVIVRNHYSGISFTVLSPEEDKEEYEKCRKFFKKTIDKFDLSEELGSYSTVLFGDFVCGANALLRKNPNLERATFYLPIEEPNRPKSKRFVDADIILFFIYLARVNFCNCWFSVNTPKSAIVVSPDILAKGQALALLEPSSFF